MFNNLSQRLTDVFGRLRGRAMLSEADVDAALRDIRMALLEADVALPVVRQFVATVQAKAVGQSITQSVTAGQQVVKIVHDAMVDMLGQNEREAGHVNLAKNMPAAMLMVGLQGSGKTTTTGKLAKFLTEKKRLKVLMASLDVQRPAAQEQLAQLGRTLNVETLPIIAGQTPLQITERALDAAKRGIFDVLLLDTAGRLSIDTELMAEVAAVKKLANPTETFLVADAMTGQDAVNTAKNFGAHIGLSGIILTRIDGDARGGAALSMRAVTGQPILWLGVGEKLDALEPFHPDRMASRILGMGDIVSLVEKAAEQFDAAEAEKMQARMEKGQFDLTDFLQQLRQMQNMGGMGGMMNLLPNMGKMKDMIANAKIDNNVFTKHEAMILSMTAKERKNPDILNANRRRRIAAGAGVQVSDLNQLLKQFQQIQTMMKRLRQMGAGGLARQGLGALFAGRR